MQREVYEIEAEIEVENLLSQANKWVFTLSPSLSPITAPINF
jgi:hypothetical protein